MNTWMIVWNSVENFEKLCGYWKCQAWQFEFIFENMVQTAELLWLFILDCHQPEHFENISIWLAVFWSRYGLILLKITVWKLKNRRRWLWALPFYVWHKNIFLLHEHWPNYFWEYISLFHFFSSVALVVYKYILKIFMCKRIGKHLGPLQIMCSKPPSIIIIIIDIYFRDGSFLGVPCKYTKYSPLTPPPHTHLPTPCSSSVRSRRKKSVSKHMDVHCAWTVFWPREEWRKRSRLLMPETSQQTSGRAWRICWSKTPLRLTPRCVTAVRQIHAPVLKPCVGQFWCFHWRVNSCLEE